MFIAWTSHACPSQKLRMWWPRQGGDGAGWDQHRLHSCAWKEMWGNLSVFCLAKSNKRFDTGWSILSVLWGLKVDLYFVFPRDWGSAGCQIFVWLVSGELCLKWSLSKLPYALKTCLELRISMWLRLEHHVSFLPWGALLAALSRSRFKYRFSCYFTYLTFPNSCSKEMSFQIHLSTVVMFVPN